MGDAIERRIRSDTCSTNSTESVSEFGWRQRISYISNHLAPIERFEIMINTVVTALHYSACKSMVVVWHTVSCDAECRCNHHQTVRTDMIADDTTIHDVTQRIDRRWIVIACKDYLLNSAHPSETRIRVQPSTQRGSKNTGRFL